MSKPKIVSFLGFPIEFIVSQFKERAEEYSIVQGGYLANSSPKEATEQIKDATIALAFPGTHFITREMMEQAPNLKLIQFWSVGYDNIDLQAAKELGITVSNNPGWNAVAVAEHTIMLILMTLKKVKNANKRGLAKDFKISEFWQMIDNTWELYNKTLGIIGLGTIGKEVAKRAKGFDPKIIYTKRTRLPPEEEKELGVEYRSFDELIKESDILTVHVPLTDETKGMIGRTEIELMKDGAIIINTARPGILDEQAAVDALKTGKLSGVGVDVVSTRMDGDNWISESPLFEIEDVVYTPHISGNSKESHIRSHVQWVENVCRYLDGNEPFYIVNN